MFKINHLVFSKTDYRIYLWTVYLFCVLVYKRPQQKYKKNLKTTGITQHTMI